METSQIRQSFYLEIREYHKKKNLPQILPNLPIKHLLLAQCLLVCSLIALGEPDVADVDVVDAVGEKNGVRGGHH